ncbi:MAG TPA: M1 family aminopeptidase [Sphingobacteriaceae bacterium]
MKLKALLCCHLLAAFFVIGCGVKKVTLDPVQIKASTPGFQGAYTRTLDIIHTKLDISFSWDSALVYGKATIEARPYFYASRRAVFNANGFRINKVALLQNEELTPLKYSYDGKMLDVDLNKTYSRDQKFTLYIDYVAMPEKLKVGADIAGSGDRGLYFIDRQAKDLSKRQIWTQGETECNSNWFPTINDPQEKMTQEISITVPEQYTTLSNGELEFTSLNGNGTRTDSWRQEKPHSTYLSMLAVGTFTITKDTWRDKEVNYYMEPQFAKNAKLIFGKTPEMMEFYSKKTGIDYPWDKYSQIVVREFVSGAMENTTASTFFDKMNMTEGQYLDQNHEDIIAHELFHHWFGDLVTAESWSNLPLNESFATYGEYLWYEHKYGREEADLHGLNDQMVYLAAKKTDLDLIRYDYSNREEMFDEVSYQKGGRILHMLRKTVGDEAFFKALNLYLTRHAYQSAEVHDLRIVFEEVTGQDLNWFFNQWFLNSGHPVLAISTDYDAASKKVRVQIRQEQNLTNTPLYTIPFAVDIYSGGKVNRQQIILKAQEQTFEFTSEMPELVNVDAEKYLLGEKIESKPLEQWVFQFQNAPLFLDRFEALSHLAQLKKDKAARDIYVKALQDKNWMIRRMAIQLMDHLTADERQSVHSTISEMALKDARSYVRAEAVRSLKTTFNTFDNAEVMKKAAGDKAPSVLNALKDLQTN